MEVECDAAVSSWFCVGRHGHTLFQVFVSSDNHFSLHKNDILLQNRYYQYISILSANICNSFIMSLIVFNSAAEGRQKSVAWCDFCGTWAQKRE